MPTKGTQKRASAVTPTEFKARVGMNVRQLRQSFGETQTELGEKVGVSVYQISRYERGIDEMSLYTAVKIADRYGVGMDTITDGAKSL